MSPKVKLAAGPSAMLTDPSVPLHDRMQLLAQLCMEGGAHNAKLVGKLLAAARKADGESEHTRKIAQLNELMEQLQSGPLRLATYFGPVDTNGRAVRRVCVILQNGDQAYPVVPPESGLGDLQMGDSVLVDAQARAVLSHAPNVAPVGEEARLERCLGEERVEAVLRDHEPFVFHVAAPLRARLREGSVEPGASLLVCPRRAMAFDVVPAPDGLSRYRFLVRSPVPDVRIDRDIGSPPGFIFELLDHLRTEMEAPALGRKYRVRRAITKLLYGVSGAGKTFSIQGFWRSMYELMAEITGVDIEALPPRVLRLRMPEVLSKWLGDSDKNLDRFFDEVEQLGSTLFQGPSGRQYELPVLVICEEIDGLARSRGTSDSTYDRIQTTALERLDMNSKRLSSGLFVFLFTSNVPHLVDSAFIRRAGGSTERFGRLGRRDFEAVLAKHLRDLPFRKDMGRDPASAERRVLREVSDWLFSPNGHDPGQLQITYVGSGTAVTRYRRDFLTAALVDRSIQQAAIRACRAERLGAEDPGITAEMVQAALDEQVLAITGIVTRHNVAAYLTLPEGATVAEVRRVEPPALQPFQLEVR